MKQTGALSLLEDLHIKDPQAVAELLGDVELKEVLTRMIDTLSARRAGVCKLYFGINCKPKRQVEIAAEIGISGSAVSGLVKLSLLQLQSPGRMDILNSAIAAKQLKQSSPVVQQLSARVQILEEKLAEVIRVLSATNQSVDILHNPDFEWTFTDLGLSARTCNILHAEGVHTLRDLLEVHEVELAKFYGMGVKSVTEIKDVLAARGYRAGQLSKR